MEGSGAAHQLSHLRHMKMPYTTAHTYALHAEKKTKCQGWLWETAAAVGMEMAAFAGRGRLCLNSLKMSKHLRGVRAMPGPNNYQPFCASHKSCLEISAITNLSIKALWPLFVLKSDSFCFVACKHIFKLANSATCKALENHSQLCLPSNRNMTSAEKDSSFRMCSKKIAVS